MGRIIKYVPMREDKIISGFELASAAIVAFLLGWICSGMFGIAVDVYTCSVIQKMGF